MLLKTSIGLVQIVNLPNIQVSGFPKLTSPSLHFFFKTQHWALICHSIGAKIYQDLKSIERYRTCLDYLFIINQNSSACFYSKQNSIVTLEFRLNLHSISGTNLPYKQCKNLSKRDYRGYMEYIAIVHKNKTQIFSSLVEFRQNLKSTLGTNLPHKWCKN